MFFLIRVVFCLCVILLILPTDPNRPEDAPSVTLMELLTAARTAIADLSQICGRNPELCVTGGEVAQVLADQARYGIEQLQGFIEQQGITDTLTAEDINIPWQDPAAPQTAYAATTP
ncbi:MAG: DUF5330 domain-containing protein [Bauldia sp.]